MSACGLGTSFEIRISRRSSWFRLRRVGNFRPGGSRDARTGIPGQPCTPPVRGGGLSVIKPADFCDRSGVMKTIPTRNSDNAPDTETAPRRTVNPFANDTSHPDPCDLPVAAGRPTICRHTNPMGCHRERRMRRSRRRPGRRRYRGNLRAHLRFSAPYDRTYSLEPKQNSVAALYERRQCTGISQYIFGGHKPPLQAQPPEWHHLTPNGFLLLRAWLACRLPSVSLWSG